VMWFQVVRSVSPKGGGEESPFGEVGTDINGPNFLDSYSGVPSTHAFSASCRASCVCGLFTLHAWAVPR